MKIKLKKGLKVWWNHDRHGEYMEGKVIYPVPSDGKIGVETRCGAITFVWAESLNAMKVKE